MNIPIEYGKFYTLIDTQYPVVFQAGMSRDIYGGSVLRANSPTAHSLDITKMHYRPATVAEIATWYDQHMAYLHSEWLCALYDTDNAKALLALAGRNRSKLGLAVRADDCS